MLGGYLSLGINHWRYLIFGILIMGLSSFGQTFFIALFGEDLRLTFSITDGELGSLYAAATVCSALTLGYVGRFIDRTPIRLFAAVVMLMLTVACVGMALSVNLLMLGVVFYLLRLFGQGLMVHTGLTAVARRFTDDRGKALGIVSLGLPLGEAILPLAVVAGLAFFGWRETWLLSAVLLVLLGLWALRLEQLDQCKMLGVGRKRDISSAQTKAKTSQPLKHLWRDPRFVLVLPAIVALPTISTGFFFHQARLASEKGWSLSWVALWFVGYAVVRAVGLLGVGPLIDRWSARKLIPLLIVPLSLALLLLAFFSAQWVAPVYLGLFGLSAAIGGTVSTAYWAEQYGSAHLGRVRAAVEALNVLGTGASPMVFGLLIDHGVDLATQAFACLVYIVLACALAFYASRKRDNLPDANKAS